MKTRTLISAAVLASLLGLAGGARASTLEQVLAHNALPVAHIAAIATRGGLAPQRAAALEQRTAQLYADEARLIAGADSHRLRQLAQEQRALLRTEARLARTRAAQTLSPMQRTHLRVAARRQAEQQRWLAQAFRHGRLDTSQVAQLEAAQAGIAHLQARLERGGDETVDQALRVQHLQDIQDWAIRTGHAAA